VGERKGKELDMQTRLAKDPERVQKSVSELPAGFRAKARKWLRARIRARHGSPRVGKVSDRERLEMYAMKKAGATFRDLEAIYHLIPVNGNDAKRQVDRAKKLVRQGAKLVSC
jgi:hypothetical protein